MNGRSKLELLFSPGAGIAPPKMAGREKVLERLDRQMNAARAGKGQSVILIGPRGNGKTVLLAEFARRCRAAGVDTSLVAPVQIGDRNALARWLLQDDLERKRTAGADEEAAVGALLPAGVSVRLEKVRASLPRLKTLGILGLLSMEFENLSAGERRQIAVRIDALLTAAARVRPRVAIIDEAHTLDPEVGQLLLNAAQKAGGVNQAPFLLILAGTPQLHRRLSAMQSSFWERCEEIGIGRLTGKATREALVEPLAEYGIEFESEALDAVVEESQRYPYFVQLWGQALCEALSEDARRIDVSTVETAHAAVDGRKTGFYERRFEELRRQDLLPAAVAAARSFVVAVADGRQIDLQGIEDAVREATGSGDDASRALADQLHDLGYVWRPPEGSSVEPGIPSLMDYVASRASAHPRGEAGAN